MANAALALLRRVGGPALVVEMIELFLMDAPPRLARIREAVACGDMAGAAAGAHSLRSSCGNLGLDGSRAACERIELEAVQERMTALPPLVAELEKALAADSDALRAELEAARAAA